jgi:hypothetical protein
MGSSMLNTQAKEDEKKPSRLHLVKTDGANPEPPSDWLTRMSDGDVFLAKPRRDPSPELTQYEVIKHFKIGVMIYEHSTQVERCWIVDPKQFCSTVQFYEYLVNGKEEKENDRNWPDPL